MSANIHAVINKGPVYFYKLQLQATDNKLHTTNYIYIYEYIPKITYITTIMLKINKKIRNIYLFKKCTFSFDLNKRKDFDWRISSGSSLKQKGPWNQKDFLAASVFTRGNRNEMLLFLV